MGESGPVARCDRSNLASVTVGESSGHSDHLACCPREDDRFLVSGNSYHQHPPARVRVTGFKVPSWDLDFPPDPPADAVERIPAKVCTPTCPFACPLIDSFAYFV